MTARPSREVAFDDLSSHTLRAVLDCLPDPALLLAPDRRVLSVNRAYADVFGGAGDAVGRPCHEVLHHRQTPCSGIGEECPLLGTGDIGQPTQSLHVHHAPAGEEHHHVRILPVGRPDRPPEAYLEILRRCDAASVTPGSDRLLGRAPAFNRMLGLVYRVAATRLPALVRGEPGTDKARVARAIHELSERGTGPFVPVSCSGLDAELLERELFGHGSAASNGASEDRNARSTGRDGALGAARRGTLFLDEIGDLPALLQVKLLRLADSGTYQPSDRTETLRADVRLVCSTHLDLAARARAGSFRADLYHRIDAFPIDVPPLRERGEDLPLLIDSLLPAIVGRRSVTLHPDTLSILAAYPFPGNLHELRHILERSCLMADGDTILPRHLPAGCRSSDASPATDRPSRHRAGERRSPPLDPASVSRGGVTSEEILPLAEVTSRYLEWAAATFRGDNSTLAKKLGVAERTLYRKLRQIRNGEALTH